MKLIVGKEKLKLMSPTGGNGRESIPVEVVEAVYSN